MTFKATLTDGTEFTVNRGELVLDAALRQGIALPHGCRGGACGACKCKIEGDIDYRDDPMALSEQDRVEGKGLPCVAEAKGDLKLELKLPSALSLKESAHQVVLQPSGKAFRVEADESLIDAAIRLGIPLPYGCRGGNCGACELEIVSGEVSYPTKPWALEQPDGSFATDKILACLARPKGDLVVRAKLKGRAALPVEQMPTKIALMKRLGQDVMQLGLKLPEEVRLQYMAGQYVDFLIDNEQRRAFSIANAPHKDALLEFHIRHVPDGKFTDRLFDTLQLGDIIRIEGPFGNFYLREESERPIIFLVTGTGFGPVKAIFEHIVAEGLTRPIYLYWGAYNQQAIYMHELVEKWQQSYDHFHYRPVLTNPEAGWQGRTGFVQEQVVKEISDLNSYEVYACGNPSMVHAARDRLVANGLSADHCYSDAFELAAPQKSE
ncbi:CDP-6-deoxy-delta-3,4-glucoseen reductase [Ectothiorhodospiraceae bacterium BW-2]|nr:CDP-6-deoxy-delta-3,4-glucoseen reductase [Ectothiorhodospiraceae bacterium BW-2]